MFELRRIYGLDEVIWENLRPPSKDQTLATGGRKSSKTRCETAYAPAGEKLTRAMTCFVGRRMLGMRNLEERMSCWRARRRRARRLQLWSDALFLLVVCLCTAHHTGILVSFVRACTTLPFVRWVEGAPSMARASCRREPRTLNGGSRPRQSKILLSYCQLHIPYQFYIKQMQAKSSTSPLRSFSKVGPTPGSSPLARPPICPRGPAARSVRHRAGP